ncbi:MAG: hypothetical protein H7Z43_08150 [Clostridia bacterium]|nr:hypothetical protein [Deltaproteobacteria bacterium]
MTAVTTPRVFPCETCGADLTFDASAQALACKFCGAKRDLTFHPEAAVVERDLEAMLRQLAEHRTANAPLVPGRREFNCVSCAATVTFDRGMTSESCAYCGSPVVDAAVHEAVERIPVGGVLPFIVERSKANENLRAWVESRWLAPNDFVRYGVQGKFSGIYLPYWTFDAMTDVAYRGQRGDHYTVTVGSGKDARREIRTRWTLASGQFRRFFDDTLVCAAGESKQQLMNSLEPWPLAQMKPFTPDALAGYHALTYDTELTAGFAVGKQRIDAAIQSDVCDRIGGDTQQVDSIRTQMSALTFKHVLLPIWMLAYLYNGKSYQVVVNACTGEVQGERPYSPWKVAFVIILALVVAAAIAIWSQQ